jgi:chaperonin GroES
MKKKAKKTKARSAVSKAAVGNVGFTPGGDRVLIKPLSPEEAGQVTSFGIIIPDTAKEKPEQGTIVAVGPGRVGDDNARIPVGYKVGDRVMFNKYGYDEIKIKGVEYFIVSETNILGAFN